MSVIPLPLKNNNEAIQYLLDHPTAVVCFMCHESAFVSNTWAYEFDTHLVRHWCTAPVSYTEMMLLRAQYSRHVAMHNYEENTKVLPSLKAMGVDISYVEFKVRIRHKKHDACCVIM